MRRTLPVFAVAILACLLIAVPSQAQSCAATPPTLSFGPPEGICPLGEPGSASVGNAGSYMRFQWSVTNADVLTPTDMTYVSFRATSEEPVGVTVNVTDFAGCIATGSLLIPTRDLGSVTIDLSHPSGACPAESVSASIAPNGQTFSRWAWSISNGELLTPADAAFVTFRATGSAPVEISVAAIDSAGCVATGVRSMPVLSIATPLISTYPSGGVCPNGAEGSAYVDSAGLSTITWSIANGVITSPTNGPSVNYRATSDLPVQLSVTVGNSSGCTATASATVPISALPSPLVLTYPHSGVCPNGAEGSAYVDNPNGIYSTYSWTIANGQFTSPANSQFVNYRATSDQPVQLSVVAGNGAGCTATGSATARIATLPAPLVLTYPQSGVCPNGAEGSAYVDNPNGIYSNYSWTITNGQFTSPPNTQFVNYRATSDLPVQLSVVVGNGAGCTAAGAATAPIATIPAPLILTYPQAGLCPNGAEGSAYVDNPNGIYSTYAWTIANGQFTSPPNTQFVNFRATSDQPVQLNVIASNASGCTASAAATMPIATVNPPAITVYPASGVCTTCPAGSAYAENPGTMFSTFSWSIANGTFTTPADQQSVQFLPTGDQPVVISLIATTANGCVATSSTTVPIRAADAPVILGPPSGLCPGGAPEEARVENPAAYTSFSWSITNGEFTDVNGYSVIRFRATTSQPVQLTVTTQDLNGNTRSSSATIPVRTLPPPQLQLPPGGICMNGGTERASVYGSTYSSYQWTISGGVFDGPSNSSEVNFHATGATPVELSVTVTDWQGCSATTSGTVPVRTLSPPQIQLPPGGICTNGGTERASVYATYSTYQWAISGGAFDGPSDMSEVSFHATGTTPVQLTVTVTDWQGCVATASGSVPIRTLAPPEIQLPPSGICTNGSSERASVVESTGSYASYQWTITGGAFDGPSDMRDVNFHATGTSPVQLTVTVRDWQGCVATQTGSVPIRTLAAPEIQLPPYGVCPNAAPERASVIDSTGAYASYLWTITGGAIDGPADMRDVNFHATGTDPVQLTVRVTDWMGCVATRSATVPVRTISAPIVQISPSSTMCTNGMPYLAAVSDPTGMYSSIVWSIVNGVIEGPSPTGPQVSFRATTANPVEITATVTTWQGCSASQTRIVGIRTIADPTIYAPATVCLGSTSSASVNSGSMTVAWTIANGQIVGAADSPQVSFLSNAAGSVTLTATVTDGAGCVASRTVTIPVTSTIPPAIENLGPALCPNGAPATSRVNSVYASYAWSIANGSFTTPSNQQQVSYVATSTQPVQLTLVATEASGCQATQTVTIPVNAPPDTTIAPSGPTTFCEGGSVRLKATYGYAAYQWSNGSTSPFIDVTQSGSYSVSVTTAEGCSATSTPTTVTVNPLPAATIAASGATTFCAGGSVTLTASAGSSWLWSTGATTQSISVTSSGSYSVTVTDANGCSSTSAPTTVTVNPMPAATISASGTTTFCEGGNVTLTASEGASWLWSNGATTQSITVSASGSYSVAVTSAAGCQATSAATNVTVNPLPVKTVSTPNGTELCPGSTVRLMANHAGLQYLWSTGETTQSIVTGVAGTYTVTITNPSTGCAITSDPVLVTALNPPTPVIAADASTICRNGRTTVRFTNWMNFSNTFWIVEGGTELVGGNATMEVGPAAGSSTITVRVSALHNNCRVTSDPIYIQVSTPDAAIVVNGPTRFCAGGSTQLTAQTSVANPTYLWSNGATTPSITVTESGNYTVRVTDAFACSATSAATAVTVDPLPVATITANGPTSFCEGGNVTLTASDGASWLWSNGATTQSITVDASGAYSVTVTHTNGCTATSAPMVVTENPPPAATITPSGPTTFCQGGSVTLTASSGTSWLWSNGATTQSITVNASGSHSVTVTDASGCSATSTAATVTVNPLPIAAITPSGPTTFCAGGSVTLTASSGMSWLWSNGATTQSTTVSASGSYSVTVTDANGCGATSSATTVTVNPLPIATITASGPTTFCEGGSVTLTASSGTNWLWSNGATTQSITVNASGAYGVTVTDANGCSAASAATTVTVNALPAATITPSGPTTFCEGGSVTLTASSGANWLWSNGATTQSITVNASGSYSVTVTNANGCSATSSATAVTVNPLPIATITPSGPTTFCEGGSVTLTASSGSSWLWSNGATTQSITVNVSGSYGVTVTNASGCSATSAATTVTVNPLPTATITPSDPTTFCAGGNVTLTASDGASWLWSNGATTRSITVADSGSFHVVVTTAAGCSAQSATTTVTENPLPIATITPSGPTTFCEGGSVTLTGSDGASWLWSNGATTRSIVVSASGAYSVAVTDSNGCSATSAVTAVTVQPATRITQQPQSATIPKNTTTTLTVGATGEGVLSYQWYAGLSGDTSQPLGTSSSYTTPVLHKGTYNYWVRVSGSCGVVNSSTATISAQ